MGFTTVIRLALKNAQIDDVKKNLLNVDPYFFLFSQNIENLIISVDGKKLEYFKKRKRIAGDEKKEKSKIIIKTKLENNKVCKQEWVRWQRSWLSADSKKRSSTMFAMPFVNGRCVPFEENTLGVSTIDL